MLKKYNENGFKLFECLYDKSPKDENYLDNILNIENAHLLQKKGNLIGALIPKDIVCLNINRDFNNNKKDGFNVFKKIKEKWNITFNFMDQTFCIRTRSGGFHFFFRKPKNFKIKEGIKDENIEVKTTGYVIASGSSGYEAIANNDFADLDNGLLEWMQKSKSIKQKIETTYLLQSKTLKQILKKIEFDTIKDKNKFISSCLITCGNSLKIINYLCSWMTLYDETLTEEKAKKMLKEWKIHDGVTSATFVKILSESNLSKHMLKKVITHENIANSTLYNDDNENPLMFEVNNYNEILKMPTTAQFFLSQGNAQAAKILECALYKKVIYIGGEKKYYYFGGSRWEELNEILNISFNILSNVSRMYFQENFNVMNDNGIIITEEDFEKVNKAISNTHWRLQTLKDFSEREKIYKSSVEWDSPRIAETITTLDGVIDFKSGKIETRNGLKEEYRKTCIEFTTDEIIESKKPNNFIQFLKDIFPNEETCEMAKYVLSMCISGNAGRRLFHLWEGDGANGKSTLVEIMQSALGREKAITYPAEILLKNHNENNTGTTPELDRFLGRYAAFGTEAEQGKKFSSAFVKKMTGGDPISVNPKYQQAYEMESTWQLILAVNDLPAFEGSDKAFIERLCVLPFMVTFCKTEEKRQQLINYGEDEKFIKLSKDKIKFVKDIMIERSGIIKYLIEYYIKLENEFEGIVPESKLSINKKNSYITDNDDYGEFIDNCCIINQDQIVFNNDLTDTFQKYIGNDKIKTNTITKNILKKLEKAGIEKNSRVNSNTGKKSRCLIGIGLKTENNKTGENPF